MKFNNKSFFFLFVYLFSESELKKRTAEGYKPILYASTYPDYQNK